MPKGKPSQERKCRLCKADFLPPASASRFCSLRCRVYAKITIPDDDGCWPWNGYRDAKGYGSVHVEGQTEKAHRVAYFIEHGYIPEGMHVLHRCDNPPCCRPDHLFLGTNEENVHDKVAKGRDIKVHGERHHRAVLKESDVREIRLLEGILTQEQLSEGFGVSKRQIGRIQRGEAWAHVDA